jgi:replicative superfamily II helicase
MLIRQAPIESRFQSKICDNLNAEIARGTVSTIAEAVEWLTYTYFFIRARLNPLAYGIDYKEVRTDPTLSAYLQDLCFRTAQRIDQNQMIRFDMR